MAVGRVDEALETYENALRYAPRNASLIVDLARAYRKSGRIEQAEKLLSTAFDLLNGNQDIRLELVAFYTDIGRWEKAVDLMREIKP